MYVLSFFTWSNLPGGHSLVALQFNDFLEAQEVGEQMEDMLKGGAIHCKWRVINTRRMYNLADMSDPT